MNKHTTQHESGRSINSFHRCCIVCFLSVMIKLKRHQQIIDNLPKINGGDLVKIILPDKVVRENKMKKKDKCIIVFAVTKAIKYADSRNDKYFIFCGLLNEEVYYFFFKQVTKFYGINSSKKKLVYELRLFLSEKKVKIMLDKTAEKFLSLFK